MLTSGPGLVVILAYLGMLLGLGWWGYRRRHVGSLQDFYLADRGLGFLVLLATLYATQYSGNTFLGYTGKAYRLGFAWVMSVGMMMSVIIVYLLFAPRLQVLARRGAYVTPGDWVRDRFAHGGLATLVSVLMAVALLNYLYAQFLAMGHAAVELSDGALPFWAGVLVLAVIIGLYETLGGMRSVAWTDVVQGVLLFGGLATVLVLAQPLVGGLAELTERLRDTHPELVAVPSWELCGTWLSSIVLLGLGAAVYPQALQRIYAARSASALQRSLKVMVWMPLTTTFVAFLLGVMAHAVLPEQSGLATERVMLGLLERVAAASAAGEWVVALVLAGGLAAIMSTADSALLSLSSIVARDFIAPWRPAWPEATLARVGKWVSWLIIAGLIFAARRPPATLWRLIEIKMELLIQVAPVLILGVRSARLDARTALTAMLAGTTVTLTALLAGADKLGGIHIGTYACALNAAICAAGMRWSPAGGR